MDRYDGVNLKWLQYGSPDSGSDLNTVPFFKIEIKEL